MGRKAKTSPPTPLDQIPEKHTYRIGEVAKLVGVDAHVLRYWESEFDMKPQRSSSGQRMYRKQDLTGFLRIRSLLHEQGYTLAGARKALGSEEPPTSAGLSEKQAEEALKRARALRIRIQAVADDYRIDAAS